MKLKYIYSVALTFLVSWTFGQTDIDALRYSRLQVIGSGRTMAVGGAFGALGGDFTTLSTNPAGIATYRHSEVSLTPSFALNNTSSNYEGTTSRLSEPYLNVSNIGLILSDVNTNPDKKWKTTNFALGTNRLANFNQRFSFEGTTRGSITARYVENANGKTPDELSSFEEGLAYDAYLIDLKSGSSDQYYTDADSNDLVYKQQDYSSDGSLNEFVISFGGNYMHRLYLGATIGLPFVRYSEQRTYRESDPDGSIPTFNSMSYTERFSTTGLGLNLKIGAIFRVNQMLRFGLAVHTPTAMTLTDNYSTGITSSVDLIDPDDNELKTYEYGEDSRLSTFEYNLRTPWRAIGSAGLIIKKNGFVTAEVEYVDYGRARFDFNSFNEGDAVYLQELNNTIANKYGQALNLRLGGEITFDKLRLRAGYAIYSSPFNSGVAIENSVITNLSFGGGYHSKGFFLDIAYVNSNRTEEYVPYTLSESSNFPVINNEMNFAQIVATIGFKFY